MNFSILTDLVELCAKKGIRHTVICPGSRSAPLTLAFTRNKKIKSWTFSDERSAGFVATGMAQQTQRSVALVCTSGSAAYNFAPAVAEAFFQQIPLVVFTADRPKEWIDQLDGQTIRQKELYGPHVKKYYELPQDYDHTDCAWHANRIVNEAVNLSQAAPKGPVHINAPFREPLYPNPKEKTVTQPVRIIEPLYGESGLSEKEWDTVKKSIGRFKKILIVSGQNEPDPKLTRALANFSAAYPWPLAGDVLSNLHAVPSFCRHADTFLGQAPENVKQSLQPELLITFGKSLVAKNLKLLLRKYRPVEHWHLQPAGEVADTFQSLTRVIRAAPHLFFTQLRKFSLSNKSWQNYKKTWDVQENDVKEKINAFFKTRKEGEFKVVKNVIEALPAECHLHVANSMAVRYANHIGLSDRQKKVTVFSNRGTSGIDGCVSTAVGHALTSDIPNIIITGDLAFFYDRNAFWHNYKLPNLFVVVLNNHGGIIFNLIDGPSGLPEAEEFFITRQKRNAKSVASEFGFSYQEISGKTLIKFSKPGGNVKILEIDSSQTVNKRIFEEFKKDIKKSYDS